jgi:predicted branched-subunit amino acid permease
MLQERDMNAPHYEPERIHDPVAWRAGFQMGLPTLFGIGAWGVVLGVALVKSGVTYMQD